MPVEELGSVSVHLVGVFVPGFNPKHLKKTIHPSLTHFLKINFVNKISLNLDFMISGNHLVTDIELGKAVGWDFGGMEVGDIVLISDLLERIIHHISKAYWVTKLSGQLP